ncbi:uncharacterized protein LOC116348739 [Contarinia nasturtii]|uniref:uncharacterized protein LOC116348739 n=1 Tax=Contarinia nasturtii TaxID=265458 RepID=UPI0012D49D64|nr:uncharacterized protein LOC116348739 [Contarinia nasturtii]
MAAYSPISSRNHRINPAPPYHISSTANSANPTTSYNGGGILSNVFHGNLTGGSRRRESINSSIGATSIRRLLTVNRGCRHKISSHIRAKVAKNFALLIISHGLMSAVLVPMFGLQASNSMWFHQESWLLRKIGPNVGPLLLGLCFFVTSGTCLLTTRLVKKFGYIQLIIAHYAILCIFLLIHLYPTIWLLIIAYFLLGITMGPSMICKWNLVVLFASRISCGQTECPTLSAMMNESVGTDDYKGFCNRNERVRRLARWFHAMQDIGILVGALIASIIISCAATESKCILTQQFFKLNRDNSSNNSTNNLVIDNIRMNTLNDTHRGIDISHLSRNSFMPNKSKSTADSSGVDDARETSTTTMPSTLVHTTTESDRIGNGLSILKYYQQSFFSQHNELLDSLFNTNERGVRICGAGSCPTWNRAFESNVTEEYNWFTFSGTIPMTLFYIILAAIALGLACLSQQVDTTFKYENFKMITDTLLLASPMAYFIGTEQGYVLGGFTRAFVSCTLGAQMVAGTLVLMGGMQLIVSCTLSMLLRHVKRSAVLVAAFFFQSCLLLVLANWKPSQDDSALFYVIAAAWGACNGIWETLLFALITLTHINSIIQISSPLQAFRFLGMGLTFATHGYLCENLKILILFILLVISVIPYAMLEIRMEGQRKAQSNSI